MVYWKNYATVSVDLARIQANAQAIRTRTGVDVIAVIKADAYGLGASAVAKAIVDIVDGFYVFHESEALASNLPALSAKPTIAMMCDMRHVSEYIAANIRPVVWQSKDAAAMSGARPVLSIDTGQQRFAAAIDDALEIVRSGSVSELMTHASTLAQVQVFSEIVERLKPARAHAAGSALLNHPAAYFDAVRPGLALYHDALTVTTRLVETRRSNGPAGYTGFRTEFFGVIPVGYSHGLRAGPCLINERRSRVLEVGMQTAFVEIQPTDHPGDSVTLIGPGLPVTDISRDWQTTPHEVLTSLSRMHLAK